MDSSGAWRQGAGTVPPQAESDASRPERSFDTPGQNERPREKQTKTGPAKSTRNPYIISTSFFPLTISPMTKDLSLDSASLEITAFANFGSTIKTMPTPILKV